MITVVAKNFAKATDIDKILALAKALAEQTVQEVGCIKYEMYQDVHESSDLIMLEEWETQEDLNRHMASDHFKRIVPQMAEYLRKKTEINIYKKVI